MVAIVFFFYMIPTGIGNCCCSEVGNLMGDKKSKEAKDFGYVSLYGGIILSGLYIILSYLIKPYVINLFTVGDEMAHRFSNIYDIYIFLFFIFDSISCILGNILRAIGE